MVGHGNVLIYAVSEGKRTCLFKNWLSCEESVLGVQGANYIGFNNLEQAKKYLTDTDDTSTTSSSSMDIISKHDLKGDSQIAGSRNKMDTCVIGKHSDGHSCLPYMSCYI